MRTELEWDLRELEIAWARRRSRLVELQQRVERSGMTRPTRSAEERAWLEQRGDLPPTREVPTPVSEQGSTPRAERTR
ncbi:MAG: hypothetical protein H0X65_06210 [Gemmatimonadetes bacterium]|jgi:IS5 family transposase|nr:hypothetical protein [Gemmatimonadota bacterium]